MTAADPFALLATERERVDRFYATLPEPAWREPTRCAGWDRKDLLAHLIGVEAYTRACLDDRIADFQADLGDDYEQANEVWVRRWKDRSAQRLLAEWRERIAQNHRRLRERGPQATMSTSVGPYPVGRQAHYLACELAIHADDAGVPVTDEEAVGRLRWRRDFGLDALAEVSPQVRVDVGSANVTVRLDDESMVLTEDELVAATSGRLPPEHPMSAALRRALTVLA